MRHESDPLTAIGRMRGDRLVLLRAWLIRRSTHGTAVHGRLVCGRRIVARHPRFDDQFRLGRCRRIARAGRCVLLKEDRWFYWHPGFRPLALTRAAYKTYVDGDRQGGSTITMQLARLTFGLNTRSASGKLRQIAAAAWLELRYSKREILEAYLNLVPFGGNIQGVAAASRIYFGKTAGR